MQLSKLLNFKIYLYKYKYEEKTQNSNTFVYKKGKFNLY